MELYVFVLGFLCRFQGLPIDICEALQATIQELPACHLCITNTRATFQELHQADIIMHVRNIAHPAREDFGCSCLDVSCSQCCCVNVPSQEHPSLQNPMFAQEQAELVREVLSDSGVDMERVIEAAG